MRATSPFSRARRSAPDAFTLIELLVVIAIIGVIVGIALPVYKSVMLSSKEAKTVTRLHLLQTSNITYSSDHNGSYVPYIQSGSVTVNGDTRTNAYWWYNPEFIAILEPGANDPYYYTNPPASACSALITADLSKAMTTSIGYNVDSLTSFAPYWPPSARQASTIPSMSKMMAFADSQDCQIQNTGAKNYKQPEQHTNYAIAFRYNNQANVVFFDGHTELLTKDKVVDNNMLWHGLP